MLTMHNSFVFSCIDGWVLEILYKIGQQNLLAEWKSLENILDTSNLDTEDPRYSLKNANKPGLLKSEVKSYIISSFSCQNLKKYIVGMYDLKTKTFVHKYACKSVPRIHLERFGVEEFRKAILSAETQRISFNRIQGYNMTLYTVTNRKVWLSNFFLSRTLLDDMIHTVCWGCAYSAEELGDI